MTRYRDWKEPYRRDLHRYSIYPRISKPVEGIQPGAVFTARIEKVEEGLVEAKLMDRKVVVKGASGKPGETIRLRITKVSGDYIEAEPA